MIRTSAPIPLLRVLLVVALAASAAFATGDPSDDARRLVREGLKQLRAGDAEGALAKFRDAQVELPESPRLHYNIGLALYRAERFEEAAKAFTLATATSDREIEKRARLQVANCAVKSGRYEEALEALNRALEVDENYADARANREWVIRKMAELARKKQEQDEKRDQEQRYIEKLQEIVGAQTKAHLGVRTAMRRRGLELRPTRVSRLDQVLDAPLAMKKDALAPFGDDEEVALFEALAPAQTELRDRTKALVEEGRTRVAEAAASRGAAGQNPAAMGAQLPADPDAAAIAKALPILEGATPLLDRAVELAEEGSWNLHASQEEVLIQLLRALDELLDELTRIIQDEVQLLKDTLVVAQTAEEAPAAERRDRATELATRQVELRERTNRFASALEAQVQAAPVGPGPTGGGTPVGQDPEANRKRFRAALDHLVAATGHMEAAEADLRAEAPEIEEASEDESRAVEELVKARAALQPPQEKSGEKGDQGEDQEQKKSESDDESEEGDQGDEKNEESGEDESSNEGEQGEDPSSGEGKGDAEAKAKEGEDERQMTPEQARQMLQRAAQRERDRRAENKEKGRRVKGGGARGGKDW